MHVADRYTFQVAWSAEDNEFVGTVKEFPSLSWLDRSLVRAFMGIRQLTRATVNDMLDSGEPLPAPGPWI